MTPENQGFYGLIPRVSETEAGQVAVAIGDARAGHQQAVDVGHQAGEQGGRGYEADGSSLGHLGPLFLKCGAGPLRDLGSIYVYQMPGATGLFAWQQFAVCNAT